MEDIICCQLEEINAEFCNSNDLTKINAKIGPMTFVVDFQKQKDLMNTAAGVVQCRAALLQKMPLMGFESEWRGPFLVVKAQFQEFSDHQSGIS